MTYFCFLAVRHYSPPIVDHPWDIDNGAANGQTHAHPIFFVVKNGSNIFSEASTAFTPIADLGSDRMLQPGARAP